MTLRDRITVTQQTLEDLIREHLESRGWDYTSDTPDHTWLYRRLLDDRFYYLVSATVALGFEDSVDIGES